MFSRPRQEAKGKRIAIGRLALCSVVLYSGAAVAAEAISPIYGHVLASSAVDPGQWAQMLAPMLRALEGILAEVSSMSDTFSKWTGGASLPKDGVIGEVMRVITQLSDQVGGLWQKIQKELSVSLKT